MHIAQDLVTEFDQEMATTRRVLERVPDGRADWKPHPKSFSLAHLAQLVAVMPGWITNALRETSLDLSAAPPYSNQATASLLEQFDEGVREAHGAIVAAQDADWRVPWSLRMGDRVLMTAPRSVIVRQNISHIVHHRAQLGVYLRLLDVPVPSMYGPTADEGW